VACVTVFLEPLIVSAVSFTSIFSKHVSKRAVNVHFCYRHRAWNRTERRKEGQTHRRVTVQQKIHISGQSHSFQHWLYLAIQSLGIPAYGGGRNHNVSTRAEWQSVDGLRSVCLVPLWCLVHVFHSLQSWRWVQEADREPGISHCYATITLPKSMEKTN